jgi:hypothetical protein
MMVAVVFLALAMSLVVQSVRLRQSLVREEQLRAEAELQRARAEVCEQLAIDAIKQFRDAVHESPELKNNPELAGLRKKLLEQQR